MALEFNGKNVLIVDGEALDLYIKWESYEQNWHWIHIDSIVRGTTSKEIIQMARDAGAKKVYFASCAPAIRYPNVYGIDMPSRKELVAHGRNDEEIAAAIGADKVIFQDLHDLVESVRHFNPAIQTFDTSVFDSCYVTGDVDESYMAYIESERSDENKAAVMNGDSDCVGLYNSYMK